MTNPQVKERLRFAEYRRVSEEEQRDYGKSLDTQRSRIEAAVEQLGGKIVARYGGQEHATPGHRRVQFEQMLADAEAGKFDAICVADYTRWSRDTVAHEQAVRRLKRSRTRLFFGPVEQDLRSAAVQIGLTINTKSSETETDARIDSSVIGRIKDAALGFATSGGDLPYGRYIEAKLQGTRRTWAANPDGTAKWEVDREKERYVAKAVKLYLRGKTWREVAQALGDDDENTVRRRVLAAGGQWQQRFRLRDGQRPEEFAAIKYFERLSFEGDYVTVMIPIPELLDERTLDRVRAKAAAHHADYRAPNKQMLGGHLRCANCGGSIGTHYHAETGAVYLQHNRSRLPTCPKNFGRYERVERSFLRQFGNMLRDPAELEAGVREAYAAEISRHPELENQLAETKAEHAALSREHDDIYKKVKALNLDEASAMMRKIGADVMRLEAQLKVKEEEINGLEQELKVTRLPPDFSARIEFAVFCLVGYGTNNHWLWTWPKAQRREMVRFLFGHQSRKSSKGSKVEPAQIGIFLTRMRDEQSGKEVIEWVANSWFPQVSDTVWLDPKVTACFRPAAKGERVDRKRLVELIRRLDIGQFRAARLMFNADKLEGTRARW